MHELWIRLLRAMWWGFAAFLESKWLQERIRSVWSWLEPFLLGLLLGVILGHIWLFVEALFCRSFCGLC